MNKISKKIVALVTMAAFVLTLVPFAAFAAGSPVNPGNSSVKTEDKNVSVDINDVVNYTLSLKNDAGDSQTGDVYVWVEKDNAVSRDVVYYASPDGVGEVEDNTAYIVYLDDGRVLKATGSEDAREMSLKITEPGTYTIKAGVVKNGVTEVDSLNDLATLKNVDNYATIEVAVPTTDELEIRDQNKTVLPFDETNTAVLNLTDATVRDGFEFNGSDDYVLTGVAKDKDGNLLKGKTFTLSTSRSDVVEFAEESVTTDENGAFSVVFSMQSQKNCTLTIANEDEGIDYTIRVLAVTTSAQNIDRSVQNGYVLAGDDENWTDTHRVFSDAVQFTITDEKGNAVTGPLTEEPAYTDADGNTSDVHDNYVKVMARPEKSTITANDLGLYWDGSNYTLRYIGAYADRVKDLVPGQYTVRVSLLSNDNATVTFNVAEFGKVEDMVVDMYAANYIDGQQKPTDFVNPVTDKVTLGQAVIAVASYVDGNGIKVPVDSDALECGFDGKAVRDNDPTDNIFATAADIPANESLLGTVIKVKVYANKQLVEKELTVVDSYNTYSLEFDPTTGPVNEDNDVTVKLVDEDGNVPDVDLGTVVTAYVEDQSNDDAKVSVDTTGVNVRNGKATISVYSDKETTADIRVIVKAGSAIYAGTLEYTFGKEDPLADRTVVMTIGSSEYVVNNNIVKGDAAPFVDSNWRTMVPIRALAEAFDAEVNWDNDARTVTINYDGGTQIVMTVGEKTYTVNGAEQTMDTEPVIQGERTYVPIRFAAEALGFTVTPLYNSNGTTGSVVFQR